MAPLNYIHLKYATNSHLGAVRLYRFPDHPSAQMFLEALGVPYQPEFKAWLVPERAAATVERGLLGITRLELCHRCVDGQLCGAWKHLRDNEKERKAKENKTNEQILESWEDLKKWFDEELKRNPFESGITEEFKRRFDTFAKFSKEKGEAARAKKKAEETYWCPFCGRTVPFSSLPHRCRHERKPPPPPRPRTARAKVPVGRWIDVPGRERSPEWAMRILGLSAMPDRATLKSVWRKLAGEYHPDRNKSPEAVDRMKLVNAAKDYLDDHVLG